MKKKITIITVSVLIILIILLSWFNSDDVVDLEIESFSVDDYNEEIAVFSSSSIVDPIDSSEDAVRAAKTIWIETYGSSLFCFSQTKHPPVSRWVHFSRNLCDFGGCGLYH